jgi:hypothetical protein
VLDVDTYDVAERAAAQKYPNRILQAFYPEMFATLGYPTRVECVGQLWRYVDLMRETRTHYNVEVLLQGLTTEEFELFKRVTRMVALYRRCHRMEAPMNFVLDFANGVALGKLAEIDKFQR